MQMLPMVGSGQLTNEVAVNDHAHDQPLSTPTSGQEAAERDSGTESDAENAEIMALVEGSLLSW